MSATIQTASSRLDKTTRLLRGLGALVLLTSASSFLVQRWNAGEDLMRYGFLLAHSVVILAAALFCGGRLGESRSARIFLWTNLAIVPAYFAVLGGLVYSQFALDGVTLEIPSYARWQAPNKLSVLVATIVTLATIVPTTLISARVLAPQRAKLVSLTYIGLCSLLLIPVRGSEIIAVLALVAAASSLFAERKWFSSDYRFRTREGRLVRAVMFVPLGFLVTRTAAFYPTSLVYTGLLTSLVGVAGWLLSQAIRNNRASTEAGEWLSATVVGAGATCIVSGLDGFHRFGALAMLGFSVVLVLASRYTRISRANFETAAALSSLTISGISLVLAPRLSEGAFALILGTFVLAHGMLLGRKVTSAASLVITVWGIAVLFVRAVGFERLANWSTLSVLGIGLVILAALLERHRDAITAYLGRSGHDDDVTPDQSETACEPQHEKEQSGREVELCTNSAVGSVTAMS